MYTRESVTHAYQPVPLRRFSRDGLIRITTYKGMVQTWPIARPTSSPHPAGAPFYLTGMDKPQGGLMSSGGLILRLPVRKVEADLSDQSTWQRSYRQSTT